MSESPASLYPWLLPPPPAVSRPKMSEIAALVAERCNLTVTDLRGPSRRRAVVWPRQEAMALMRRVAGRSYPQIGQFFNRDHTTAIHGVRAHWARVEAARGQALREQSFRTELGRIETTWLEAL